MKSKNIISAGTRKEWRSWLEKHYLTEKKVGVIVHKKHTNKPSLSHREYMNEAICFGWIDTTIKSINEETFLRYFARRNDKSKWSENTLSYAKELLAEGRMSLEGIKRYKEGLQRKTHDHGIPKNPKMPRDLKKALEEENVLKQFTYFTKSAKRMHLRWLPRAKLPETRKKRIKEIINQISCREVRKNV